MAAKLLFHIPNLLLSSSSVSNSFLCSLFHCCHCPLTLSPWALTLSKIQPQRVTAKAIVNILFSEHTLQRQTTFTRFVCKRNYKSCGFSPLYRRKWSISRPVLFRQAVFWVCASPHWIAKCLLLNGGDTHTGWQGSRDTQRYTRLVCSTRRNVIHITMWCEYQWHYFMGTRCALWEMVPLYRCSNVMTEEMYNIASQIKKLIHW